MLKAEILEKEVENAQRRDNRERCHRSRGETLALGGRMGAKVSAF